MHLSKIQPRYFLFAFLILVISGCSMLPSISKNQSGLTTENADLIRTDSAQTVVAAITQEAIDNPSATPIPVEPTATEARPTAVEAAVAQATATPVPSATKVSVSAPASKPAYACNVLKQDPHDGYPIEADGFFDVTWTVQNTGTATWSEDFIYRWWKGDQIAQTAHHLLPRETLPDKTVDLTVDMIAPDGLGSYTTWWELVDPNGTQVCKFYLTIVVDAPTETITPTPYY